MKGLSDIELLEAYASERSEEAFRELVARHVDFIYSAAMRQLRNPHQIEELFAKLSTGGAVLMPLDTYGFSRRFGWVSDRYGVSWQLNLPNERST